MNFYEWLYDSNIPGFVILVVFAFATCGSIFEYMRGLHASGKTVQVYVRKSLLDEYRRTYVEYLSGKCGFDKTQNELVEIALSCDIRNMQSDLHGWKHEVEEIWKEASEGGE